MKMRKMLLRVLAAVIAVGLCVVVYVVAAQSTPGSSSDPLVTLSYVTNVLTPQLESYVDQKIAAESANLQSAFDMKVSAFSYEISQQGSDYSP